MALYLSDDDQPKPMLDRVGKAIVLLWLVYMFTIVGLGLLGG